MGPSLISWACCSGNEDDGFRLAEALRVTIMQT